MRSTDGVRLLEEDGTIAAELAGSDVHRIVWSPAPQRVLVEDVCTEDPPQSRHRVFDDAVLVFENDCGAHEFVAWAPDAEAFAVRETWSPSEESRPARFRVVSVEGEATEWLEGSVCAFRPS